MDEGRAVDARVASQTDLARRIFSVSNLRGEFRLRSGAVSNEYFDKYLFESDPVLLKDIAVALCGLVPQKVEVLAGLELGGIPIATMVSQMTGRPAAFVRKKAKEYGTCKVVEGAGVAGKQVAVIEDVVTSGGQIVLSSRELRNAGAFVACVLCVIDREAGGRENLAKEGLELRPLYTMSELKSAAGG